MASPLLQSGAGPAPARSPSRKLTLSAGGSGVQALIAAARLRLARRLDTGGSLLPRLARARVDLLPHQVDAALFALNSPLRRGVVLADEVGLGKTIEAGLVVSELLARGARRVLVLVPASLRMQWQSELEHRFGIAARVVDGSSLKRTRGRPFERDGVYVMSQAFGYRRRQELAEVAWDLVVIDEAHRLRNVYKPGAKQARGLRDALLGRPKLLLTATPLQNSLLELYGLLSFIDDKLLGTEYAFRSQFVADERGLEGRQLDLLRERIAPLVTRTLRRQVSHYVRFTRRRSILHDFEPSAAEQELYQRVSAYLMREDVAAIEPNQRALLVLIYRKLLASSSVAIAPTLRALADRVEAMLEGRAGGGQTAIDELEGFEEQAEAFREARRAQRRFSRAELSAELQELRAAAELAASIGVDAKARELRRALAGVLREARQRGWPDKAVVFTESRRTADYLAGMLRADGLTVTCYSGSSGGPEERQALLDEFRQRSQVLLATEAGAEGLNLQFANIVVNYDLPWNPQRIEQRIGRCHRYGQQLDVVVVNLLNTANAADRRLYELLCDKLQLFDGVFGSSDELLGGLGDGLGFERRVLDIYQSCRQPEEIERAFAALQGELEGKLEARLAQARERLLENFDGEVATRLEATEDALREELELGAELVARLLAGCAERIEPQADGSLSIAWPAALRRQRLPERVRLAEPGPPTAEWLHPGHAALESLGGWLAERCGPPHVERLRLKPGREPAVDALGADQLLLGVFRVRVEGASSEERLLYAGLVAGRPLAPELVERLLAQPLPRLKGRAVLDGACLVELARQASLQAEQLSRSLRETSAGWLAEERDKLREWVDGALKQDEDRIAALEQRLAEAREQLGALGPELEPAAPDARLRQGLLQLWEGEHRAALRQRGEDERRLRRQAEQAVAELERRLEVERRLEPVAFASVELV